jgi:2-dehydropantoate 2-reductase
MEPGMKFLIWGAGAMGGTVGAYLVRAGHDVTFVDRMAEHVDTININGLHITGPLDDFVIRAPAFTPETVTGTFETILLCVKAHDTPQATQALTPHLASDGMVVSIQNGLNERVIANIVRPERVIGAFVNFGADYMEPGVIHRGNRGAVVLGELDGRMTPRLHALHATMLDFDDRAIVTTNIWGYLWGKLAYGAQLFATALTNESIADALALPDYRGLFIALAREVLAVAQALDVTPEGFNGFDPDAFLPDAPLEVSRRSLDDMVTFNRASAKTHSGIWRDLAIRKRRTEVDAQLGPIVALGAEAGVPTPLTARLIELIHAIENGEQPQDIALLALLKNELNQE